MSNPLHAGWYADAAVYARTKVIENVPVARDTFRLRFECSQIAQRIVPGQFLMLRMADGNDPLLGRPLALYDTVLSPDGQPWGLDVIYLVVGKMTGRLAHSQPGQELELWGPLGNGFPPQRTDHLLMVAGGIGQTPFLALAREYLGRRCYGTADRSAARADRITLCYGARNGAYLAGVDDFRALGIDVRLSTDDGSVGQHGLVTDLARRVLDESPAARIVCCGPEQMMEAVAGLAESAGVDCQVSLETPMACGIGACFSCVARVRQPDGGWDYKRTCVEGPIFDAAQIEW